jgi:hypothetical protein
MNPVNAIRVIAGTSSVPRNEVSHGPRIGLRQNRGLKGVVGGRGAGPTDGAGALRTTSSRDSVTDMSNL